MQLKPHSAKLKENVIHFESRGEKSSGWAPTTHGNRQTNAGNNGTLKQTAPGRRRSKHIKFTHLSVSTLKKVQLYSQKLTWTPGPLCGSPAERSHLHSNEPGKMKDLVSLHCACEINSVTQSNLKKNVEKREI